MRDIDIRIGLKNTYLNKYYQDSHSKVVEELKLPVAGAIIDMAVINGSLHGFEIKSAVDTLQRLPSQLEAYSKVFDYLTVVTENKHEAKVAALLPEWVGIYVCCEKKGIFKIKKIRQSKQNKNREGFFIAKLLWREEILSILEENNISYKKKDRNWLLCEALSKSMDIKLLSDSVRKKLKARSCEWKILEETM